jgi:hypothetical protein
MPRVETLPAPWPRPRLAASYARTALLLALLTALVVVLADVLGGTR